MSTLNLISHRLLLAALPQKDRAARGIAREKPGLPPREVASTLSLELLHEDSALPSENARPLQVCAWPSH